MEQKAGMIEIRNLTKFYGGLCVYDGLNLSLDEGKITCILGESGSGKTTLLNYIASLTDCKGEMPKLKCSYVFQSPYLVPNLTVFQNLKLVCKDENKIFDIIKKVHLEEKINAYPVNLSGGQAQRVSLARAFLCESEIILMDEPFSSLDLKLKKEISQLFLAMWREEKRTAIFVTHSADEAAYLSHRILVINGGKISSDYTPETCPPREDGDFDALRKTLISNLLDI